MRLKNKNTKSNKNVLKEQGTSENKKNDCEPKLLKRREKKKLLLLFLGKRSVNLSENKQHWKRRSNKNKKNNNGQNDLDLIEVQEKEEMTMYFMANLKMQICNKKMERKLFVETNQPKIYFCFCIFLLCYYSFNSLLLGEIPKQKLFFFSHLSIVFLHSIFRVVFCSIINTNNYILLFFFFYCFSFTFFNNLLFFLSFFLLFFVPPSLIFFLLLFFFSFGCSIFLFCSVL